MDHNKHSMPWRETEEDTFLGSGARPEPTQQAMRFNTGKPKLSFLLDAPRAVHGVTAVLEFGGQKYARGNFKKGLPYTEVIDSMLRHLVAFQSGEDADPESNLPHVDHILCNALFLSELFHDGSIDCDDRVEA